MSQVQCDYIAELLGKLAECVKKLAAEQADNLRLREALEYHQAQTRPIQRTEEALSATADLGEYTYARRSLLLGFTRIAQMLTLLPTQ
ncbi:MAG: hypothetical protein IPG22_06640 [Acidobacteria bacterium]|nr:hypothetical protein [Acidobacteriota bacterium]